MTGPPEGLDERELGIWLDGLRSGARLLDRAADEAAAADGGDEDGRCGSCGSEVIQSLGGDSLCPGCDI